MRSAGLLGEKAGTIASRKRGRELGGTSQLVTDLQSITDQTTACRGVGTWESPGTLLRTLQHLMDFAHTHFLMEEHLMEGVHYPSRARDEMIAQHAEFTSYSRLRVLEFRKGALVSVLPLQAYLAEWLTLHEIGLDRLLAEFIREQSIAPADSPGANT